MDNLKRTAGHNNMKTEEVAKKKDFLGQEVEQEDQDQDDEIHDVERWLQGCTNAKSPEQQTKAFQNLASYFIINNNNTSSTVNMKERTIRQILLECPYRQLQRLIDPIIDACGWFVAVPVCISILKEMTSKRITEGSSTKLPPPSIVNACWLTIRRLLLSTTDSTSNSVPEVNPAAATEIEIKQFVKTLLLLPQIISNACHTTQINVPLGATPTKFYPRLVECSLLTKKDPYFFQSLVHSLLRSHGKSDSIAIGLQKHHPCLQFVNIELNARESAAIVLAILLLRSVSTTKTTDDNEVDAALETCRIIAKKTSFEEKEVWVQILILKKSSSMISSSWGVAATTGTSAANDIRLVPLIMDLLKQNHDDDDDNDFHQHMCDIAETWSQWTFIHETDVKKQRFVTQAVLYGMQLLDDEKTEDEKATADTAEEDELNLILLQGVSNRLESFQPAIRQDGMKVAKSIARRLGQTVHFDELADDDNGDEAQQQTENGHGAPGEEGDNLSRKETQPSPQAERKKPKPRKIKRLVQTDPDADYDSDFDIDNDTDEIVSDSDDDDDDDSTVWDDDDELVPRYDLNDDEEDLVETPTPVHLLDALELLRTTEKDEHAYSHHETGLKSLPQLIRKRPDDLPDVSVSLTLELLRMENKFNLEGFGIKKHESLVALTVTEPIVVGQKLIDELFRDSALADRLNMLAAIQEGAYELSGYKSLDEKNLKIRSRVEQPQEQLTKAASPITTESKQGISSQPTSQQQKQIARLVNHTGTTRRKRSARKAMPIFVNTFSSVAPIWFYSLVAGFIKNKEKEALWTGSTGTQLLAELLRTLATIVEFSGVQSSTQVLAKDLFELAWPFHDTDVAEIRLSVLVAVATAFTTLPQDQMLQLLVESGGKTLPDAIGNMSSEDPSPECRSLAQAISTSIVDVLDQSLITT